MRVRSFLSLGIDASSGVLDEGRRRLQRAVRPDRHHRNASPAVVRDQNVPPGLVHDEMGRAASDRRLLIQRGQPARVPIDGERADRSAFFALEIANLVDRIQKVPARMNGQETGTGRLSRQLRAGQRSRGEIEARNVDAFALVARVSAEVHKYVASARRRSAGLAEGRHRQDRDAGNEQRGEAGEMTERHLRIR